MSTTILPYQTMPALGNGISLTVDAVTAWLPTQWEVIAPVTNEDMYIAGISYQNGTVGGQDAVREGLIEVGFGAAGYEVVQIQVPTAQIRDTGVTFVMPARIFLPEPVFVPKGTVVSVRVYYSLAAIIVSGIKLIIQKNTTPIQIGETLNIENNKNFSGGSDMWFGERGGTFR